MLAIQVEAMEKTVDGLVDAGYEQNKLFSEYNSMLKVHIARSEALEKHVDLLEEKLTGLPTRMLQIISILGGVVMLIKTVAGL